MSTLSSLELTRNPFDSSQEERDRENYCDSNARFAHTFSKIRFASFVERASRTVGPKI